MSNDTGARVVERTPALMAEIPDSFGSGDSLRIDLEFRPLDYMGLLAFQRSVTAVHNIVDKVLTFVDSSENPFGGLDGEPRVELKLIQYGSNYFSKVEIHQVGEKHQPQTGKLLATFFTAAISLAGVIATYDYNQDRNKIEADRVELQRRQLQFDENKYLADLELQLLDRVGAIMGSGLPNETKRSLVADVMKDIKTLSDHRDRVFLSDRKEPGAPVLGKVVVKAF
jgi:hypothetical protein